MSKVVIWGSEQKCCIIEIMEEGVKNEGDSRMRRWSGGFWELEGIFSEGWIMTCVVDLEWTELTAGIEEEEVAAVFTVMIKEDPGVQV